MARAIALAAIGLVATMPQAYGAGLLGLGGSTTTTFTWQQISQMGHLYASNGHIYPGCHSYAWTYSIHPPAGYNWEVDVYISGPRGTQYATNALMKGADAYTGKRYYRLCSAVSLRGAYTITSVMNLWGDDGRDQRAHLAAVHYWMS
jgi:hypothetical protein